MSILECKNLSKQYKDIKALDNINLELQKGRLIGLLGPNGSGKTTLIKLANGLLKPSGGQILINGQEPNIDTKGMIAYLPDRDFLPKNMKVGQLLDFYSSFFKDFNLKKAEDMLNVLGITKNQYLVKLSKGNKEKVQLILTMSRDAEIYLLDEPIAGVDPAARDYIIRTIINNYSPDALVLISTHLIADVENVLDEVIFIRNGEMILHKGVDEIREEKNTSVDNLFREVFKC